MNRKNEESTLNWSTEERTTASRQLLKLAAQATQSQTSWMYLSAAHIAGQTIFHIHLLTHWAMLKRAVLELDMRQSSGQFLRLLLVPVGHAVQRLPVGNTGLAQVSAFKPMPVAPEMQTLISQYTQPVCVADANTYP